MHRFDRFVELHAVIGTEPKFLRSPIAVMPRWNDVESTLFAVSHCLPPRGVAIVHGFERQDPWRSPTIPFSGS